jgi:alanyl-tRNA synthetase
MLSFNATRPSGMLKSLDLLQVAKNAERILRQINIEEEKFLGTIGGGESVLNKMIAKAKANGSVLSGAEAFLMYDTHGFPLELTKEVAEAEGLKVDNAGFEAAMQEQKQRSKVQSSFCLSEGDWGGAVDADPRSQLALCRLMLTSPTLRCAVNAFITPPAQIPLSCGCLPPTEL